MTGCKYWITLSPVQQFVSIRIVVSYSAPHLFVFRYKLREEFREDVNLMFHNCEIFNEDDSPVGKSGHNMRVFFDQRWSELIVWWNQDGGNNPTLWWQTKAFPSTTLVVFFCDFCAMTVKYQVPKSVCDRVCSPSISYSSGRKIMLHQVQIFCVSATRAPLDGESTSVMWYLLLPCCLRGAETNDQFWFPLVGNAFLRQQ